MYYNLTEDQKAFYETSYSLLKAGYTNEEIVEFWSNDNEEEVEFILESLEYVDINRKDPDFIELNEGALKIIQYGTQYGSRAWQGLKTAAKFVTNPITRNLALRSRNAAKIKELAALTNPTPAQRNLYNTLAKRLPNAAKKNPTKWQTDKLTQVRPGSSTYRPTPVAAPAAAPPPAAPPPAAPVKPTAPLGVRVRNTIAGTLTTGGIVGGTAAGLYSNQSRQNDSTPEVKPTEVKPTEPKVEPTEVKPRKTDPNKKADQDNFTSDGSEIKIGDEVGGPEFARPAPETRAPKTPKTQVTPEVKPPSRKKERFRFGSYNTPGLSRDGVTGGVNNSYEYAIDKLISEGHASSVEEAEYVFKQLDDDFIKAFIS